MEYTAARAGHGARGGLGGGVVGAKYVHTCRLLISEEQTSVQRIPSRHLTNACVPPVLLTSASHTHPLSRMRTLSPFPVLPTLLLLYLRNCTVLGLNPISLRLSPSVFMPPEFKWANLTDSAGTVLCQFPLADLWFSTRCVPNPPGQGTGHSNNHGAAGKLPVRVVPVRVDKKKASDPCLTWFCAWWGGYEIVQ